MYQRFERMNLKVCGDLKKLPDRIVLILDILGKPV